MTKKVTAYLKESALCACWLTGQYWQLRPSIYTRPAPGIPETTKAVKNSCAPYIVGGRNKKNKRCRASFPNPILFKRTVFHITSNYV